MILLENVTNHNLLIDAWLTTRSILLYNINVPTSMVGKRREIRPQYLLRL